MAAWGNALGGWRKQSRAKNGRFGSGVGGKAKKLAKSSQKPGLVSKKRTGLTSGQRRAAYLNGVKKQQKSEKRKATAKKVAIAGAGLAAVGAVAYGVSVKKNGRNYTNAAIKAAPGLAWEYAGDKNTYKRAANTAAFSVNAARSSAKHHTKMKVNSAYKSARANKKKTAMSALSAAGVVTRAVENKKEAEKKKKASESQWDRHASFTPVNIYSGQGWASSVPYQRGAGVGPLYNAGMNKPGQRAKSKTEGWTKIRGADERVRYGKPTVLSTPSGMKDLAEETEIGKDGKRRGTGVIKTDGYGNPILNSDFLGGDATEGLKASDLAWDSNVIGGRKNRGEQFYNTPSPTVRSVAERTVRPKKSGKVSAKAVESMRRDMARHSREIPFVENAEKYDVSRDVSPLSGMRAHLHSERLIRADKIQAGRNLNEIHGQHIASLNKEMRKRAGIVDPMEDVVSKLEAGWLKEKRDNKHLQIIDAQMKSYDLGSIVNQSVTKSSGFRAAQKDWNAILEAEGLGVEADGMPRSQNIANRDSGTKILSLDEIQEYGLKAHARFEHGGKANVKPKGLRDLDEYYQRRIEERAEGALKPIPASRLARIEMGLPEIRSGGRSLRASPHSNTPVGDLRPWFLRNGNSKKAKKAKKKARAGVVN